MAIQGVSIIASDSITNTEINSAAAIERSKLARESKKYGIPLELLRVFDAYNSALPSSASSDDLGFINGTAGTTPPTVQTSDSKNTTTTQRARFVAIVPAEYDSGQTLSIVPTAGMKTTVASSSATVDFEVYKKTATTDTVGSDICATSATSINSLTCAEKEFTITPSGLVPGDELDIRMTIAITDSATATAVIGMITKMHLLCSVKG